MLMQKYEAHKTALIFYALTLSQMWWTFFFHWAQYFFSLVFAFFFGLFAVKIVPQPNEITQGWPEPED